MTKQIRFFITCIICIIALIFVVFPVKASNMRIKINFGIEAEDKIYTDNFNLYYAIDGGDFSEEYKIKGTLDDEKNEITFKIDPSLEKKITQFMLAFPEEDKILKLQSVAVSSGGLIKKNYTADYFFNNSNVPYTHGIGSINPVSTRGIAYIKTTTDAPYVLISEDLSTEIGRSFSNYHISRIVLVLLAVLSIVSYRVNVFGVKNEE